MAGRRANDEGTLSFDERRQLWVGRLPRSVDPKRRAFYGKTQRAARDKMSRARRDADAGLTALSENAQLGTYLAAWLEATGARVRAGKIAPTTAAGYERAVRLHLVPHLGRVPLRQLTPSKVETMFGVLHDAGFKPATIRHVRATLSRALSDAMRDELVVRNVARLVEPPKLPSRQPSAFSRDEYARISIACQDDRLGPLFLFIGLTGLRRSEALGLQWQDVDLDDSTFRVRQGLHQITASAEAVVGRKGLVTGRPKTEASGARLPLSRPARELLAQHRVRQLEERVAAPIAWPDRFDDTHVFASTTGTPLHPSNVSRAWRALLERAAVPHRSPDGRARGLHELRRTFATRLRDEGIPLEDVQRLGRWTSSKMLLEVYSASDDHRLRRAAEAVGEALS